MTLINLHLTATRPQISAVSPHPAANCVLQGMGVLKPEAPATDS